MTPSPLFRPQAIAARRARLHGRVLLPRSTAMVPAAVAAVVLVGAALVGASIAEMPRHEAVTGVVWPRHGLVRVSAVQAGAVQAVLVRAGQRVRAGEPVVHMTSGRHLADGLALEAGLAAALAERARRIDERSAARAAAHALEVERIAAAQAEVRATGTATRRLLELAIERERHAVEQVAAVARLQSRGHATLYDRRLADDRVLDRREARLRLEQELARLEASAVRLRQDHARARVEDRRDRAVLATERAALGQERMAMLAGGDAVLVAPVGGRIVAVDVEPGERVESGQTALTVQDDAAPLEVRLLVPSRSIGLLRAGQHVGLRYEAFPHVRYGIGRGRIRAIEPVARDPRATGLPLVAAEPVYTVRVAPEPYQPPGASRPLALLAGMRLQADIVLERRTLLEWLLEPALALRGRLHG